MCLTSPCSRLTSTSVAQLAFATEGQGVGPTDQRLNQMVVDGTEEFRQAGFDERKSKVYEDHTARIMEIFKEIGYPSATLVGEEASEAFWLLVQHSDSKPMFQEEVLLAMKPVVLAGEASNESLALLTDRVRINTDRPQLYGTQVEFDVSLGRATPKQLEEPRMVDRRRAEVGLGPLWEAWVRCGNT